MLRIAKAQTRPRSHLTRYYIPVSLSLHTSSAQRTKMPLSPVRAVAFPSESKLRSLYGSAYFIDAFAVSLPEHKPGEYNADALTRAFFSEAPAWFSVLMWIRDRAVSIFGVKRSTEIQAAAEQKGIDTIGVFPVISRTENEVIVGEIDRHLNFQTAILIRENRSITAGQAETEDNRKGKEMVAITVVHCHGVFGKAYLTIIKPFHVMIVKYSLARVPNRITTNNY